MRFALRWLAWGLVASVISLAASQVLPPQPIALHVVGFFSVVALTNIAMSWRSGADARGFAFVIGLSLILLMAGLTLFIPGWWAPWF